MNGSTLLLPKEEDKVVLYVELSSANPDLPAEDFTLARCIETARTIFQPFQLDIDEEVRVFRR
jgi:hypothetical protein